MKKLYTFLILAFTVVVGNAQTINIPSASFKSRLLAASASNTFAKNLSGNYFKIDSNNNGEIEVSEAEQVSWLYARQCGASSLTGIAYFTNLQTLHCDENTLTTLNVSACVNLLNLYCSNNYLSSINVTGCPNLRLLYCDQNYLTSLNINSNPLLVYLNCSDNMITSINTPALPILQLLNFDINQVSYIDVMNCTLLTSISCSNNPQLTTLLVKNGQTNISLIYNCPNLNYLCCDESEYADYHDDIVTWGYSCTINDYCSFVPGGVYYSFQGKNIFDINSNGCDTNDPWFPFFSYKIDGIVSSSISISDNTGEFNIAVPQGNYTFTPIIENPTYFNISPAAVSVSFPGDISPFSQDFCITANGNHPDLEISILPLDNATPGFESNYKLVYKNKGNQIQSGSILLSFDDIHTDFVGSSLLPGSIETGSVLWNYTNLEPFETREFNFVIHINTPTDINPINIGDQLNYDISINPIPGDEIPFDNVMALKQIVVASHDPNDKECLEGELVGPEIAGKYVHYIIRFENTGNYPAENIVVKDIIDSTKYEINSLVPLSGSASFVTRITDTNKVEFIFENINLPFDDTNNDGYVAFKIKTKPTLVLGDTFSNTANIYFDYNFPITTNTASTTITALSSQDFDFNSEFSLSPIPTKNVLTITSKQTVVISSVNIYNTLGQLVQVITNPNETIDVSGLKTGSYFIKIISDKGTASSKFIKQ